jgi:exonuclease VII large subunit
MIAQAAQASLFRWQMELEKRSAELAKLDPRRWIEQGWTQLSIDQRPVRDAGELSVGQSLRARLKDARLRLTIETIENIPQGASRE